MLLGLLDQTKEQVCPRGSSTICFRMIVKFDLNKSLLKDKFALLDDSLEAPGVG